MPTAGLTNPRPIGRDAVADDRRDGDVGDHPGHKHKGSEGFAHGGSTAAFRPLAFRSHR